MEFTAYTPARLSDLAKALAHPSRLAILRVLAERQSCVCGEIVDVMPLAQATVSQHLKVLKDAGLVQGTIEGPRSCYCIDGNAMSAAARAFADLFGALTPPASCCA